MKCRPFPVPAAGWSAAADRVIVRVRRVVEARLCHKGRPAGSTGGGGCSTLVSREFPSLDTDPGRPAGRPFRLRQVVARVPLRAARAVPGRLLQGGRRPDAAAGAGQLGHRLGLPRSWDAEAAVAAIAELCRTGRTRVPVYDIATSSRVGEETLDIERTPLFIAEGIFAADIVERCRDLGLLADALCLRGRPSTTFRRRLLRDLQGGPQVRAVPAAPRLAPDARRARHRGRARRRSARTRAARRRPRPPRRGRRGPLR